MIKYLNSSGQKNKTQPFGPTQFQLKTTMPVSKMRRFSAGTSDKSVTFISDYKKRRAEKVV